MNIAVIGTGYVGIVTAVCLAESGHNVTAVDIMPEKVEMVNSGKSPVFEPGLDALILKNVKEGRLRAGQSINAAADIFFICVGTPSKADGSTDIGCVISAAKDIGNALMKSKNRYCAIIVKSTVPPMTTESLITIIENESGKKCSRDFGISMNPEFLREGSAISDFKNPGRIVVGCEDWQTFVFVKKLYSGFSCPIIRTTLRTAEMIKYTSNAFLATKISFANEIGNLCKQLSIDVYDVMEAVGMDSRIGRAFLNAGVGYGGSCFPKDVSSIAHTARKSGVEPKIINAVIDTNKEQPLKLVNLAERKIGTLKNKKITVLGMAFKPGSDDMREAPSIRIINELLKKGAKIIAYDPAAMENARKIIGAGIGYAKSLKDALDFSSIVFILAEWEEFKDETLYSGKVVFDGRRVLSLKSGKYGDMEYEGVCW